MKKTLYFIFMPLLLIGCDRKATFEDRMDPGPAYALHAHVAWVIPGQKEVFLLNPSTMKTKRIALEGEPDDTHRAPDGQGLLVLDAEGATWIPSEDAGVGNVERIPLDGAYRKVAFAPGGTRAVLFGEAGGAGATLSNPNQIAIVDLSAGTAVERTLRSYGSAPQKVMIAPEGTLAGSDRQMAWLLAERYLAVLDLSAPEATEVVVHLVLSDDTREVTPTDVAFADIDGSQTAFIRAQGRQDVFSLVFPQDAAADEVPRPYLNQLAGAPQPSDLIVRTVADGQRVFTVGRQSLSITHPITGRRTSVDVGLPISNMVPFTALRGDELVDGDGQYALLWSPGSPAVAFADLDLVELRGGRAITPLVLSSAVTHLQPLPQRRGAVARLGNTGLALLDFEARTATPLTASGRLNALVVSASGDEVYALVEDGDFALVTVDTTTGSATSTPLSDGGELLHIAGVDRTVVNHPQSWGHMSVLEDDTITERNGVFLEGTLDP